MEHYKRTQIVAEHLKNWIIDNERTEWTTFTRQMTLNYGVRKRFLERLMQENYPTLKIENDALEHKE